MTETTCSMCDNRAESQWRIRLERETDTTSEDTPYRLCRNCWDQLTGQFSVSEAGS